MSATRECPVCAAPLQEIRYEGGSLNEDQFMSVRAGDWFCESNAEHGAHKRIGAYVYFWNRELPQRLVREQNAINMATVLTSQIASGARSLHKTATTRGLAPKCEWRELSRQDRDFWYRAMQRALTEAANAPTGTRLPASNPASDAYAPTPGAPHA